MPAAKVSNDLKVVFLNRQNRENKLWTLLNEAPGRVKCFLLIESTFFLFLSHRFSPVIADRQRARWHWLGHCFLAVSGQSESLVWLSAVHCDCGEERSRSWTLKMHADLLSIPYLCRSGYEVWVLSLCRRPHLRLSQPSFLCPSLLAPPVDLVSSLAPMPPRWQPRHVSYRQTLLESSFLSSQPPWRLAPVPITQTDGADPDPSPRLQGRQKNLTRGGGVGWGCRCMYVGEKSEECCFVTMETHCLTSCELLSAQPKALGWKQTQ